METTRVPILEEFDHHTMSMQIYLEQFENYCQAYTIGNDHMVGTFLTCIIHELYSQIKDIFALDNVRELPYIDFKYRILDHFVAMTNVVVERYKCHSIKQREFQTSQD